MKLHAVNVLFCIKNPKKRPMSIKSLIYIKLHSPYLKPTLLLNYSLPSHAFEELSSSSALLNQKLGKFPLTHSGKFTKSWKKIPLPQWKIYQKLEKSHSL